jgi:nicotinamidase-related amidase
LKPFLLKADLTQVLLIDMQEKLFPAIHDTTHLLKQAQFLLSACSILGVPVKYTEHYPKGLGATLPELSDRLPEGSSRFEKIHFSCWAETGFNTFFHREGRSQVILAGIEAHICVFSTAMELLNVGYDVSVAADAVGSRNPAHRDIALETLRHAGASVLPVESIVYQLLEKAGTPAFKQILAAIK